MREKGGGEGGVLRYAPSLLPLHSICASVCISFQDIDTEWVQSAICSHLFHFLSHSLVIEKYEKQCQKHLVTFSAVSLSTSSIFFLYAFDTTRRRKERVTKAIDCCRAPRCPT